jgi:hypothetical protein
MSSIPSLNKTDPFEKAAVNDNHFTVKSYLGNTDGKSNPRAQLETSGSKKSRSNIRVTKFQTSSKEKTWTNFKNHPSKQGTHKTTDCNFFF